MTSGCNFAPNSIDPGAYHLQTNSSSAPRLVGVNVKSFQNTPALFQGCYLLFNLIELELIGCCLHMDVHLWSSGSRIYVNVASCPPPHVFRFQPPGHSGILQVQVGSQVWKHPFECPYLTFQGWKYVRLADAYPYIYILWKLALEHWHSRYVGTFSESFNIVHTST